MIVDTIDKKLEILKDLGAGYKCDVDCYYKGQYMGWLVIKNINGEFDFMFFGQKACGILPRGGEVSVAVWVPHGTDESIKSQCNMCTYVDKANVTEFSKLTGVHINVG